MVFSCILLPNIGVQHCSTLPQARQLWSKHGVAPDAIKLMSSEWAKTKVVSTSDSSVRRELIEEAGYFPTELHCGAQEAGEAALEGRGGWKRGSKPMRFRDVDGRLRALYGAFLTFYGRFKGKTSMFSLDVSSSSALCARRAAASPAALGQSVSQGRLARKKGGERV